MEPSRSVSSSTSLPRFKGPFVPRTSKSCNNRSTVSENDTYDNYGTGLGKWTGLESKGSPILKNVVYGTRKRSFKGSRCTFGESSPPIRGVGVGTAGVVTDCRHHVSRDGEKTGTEFYLR